MRFLRRRFDALPRTDPDSSFLFPFPIPFFISWLPFLASLSPISLLSHLLLVCCQISTIHASFLFPTSFLPSPTFCFCPFPSFLASYPLLIPYLLLSSLLLSDLFVCLYAGSVLHSLIASLLVSFSRYLPPSFPFNLFLKVFYFLSKLLFPSLYLSFFPYPLSLSPSIFFFPTLFPLSFFDSLTVFFPLYTLISFLVTFIHFLPPSFLFLCPAYLPSSPCFLFPSLLS